MLNKYNNLLYFIIEFEENLRIEAEKAAVRKKLDDEENKI